MASRGGTNEQRQSLTSSERASGPFEDDLHRTPAVLWVSVALMCLGVALVGGAVVALSTSTATALLLFVGGGVMGAVGLLLAARHHVMRDVD
ncbi:MAG: hypothetical protein ACXVFU_16470 [Nocardioidaceae bacterium]